MRARRQAEAGRRRGRGEFIGARVRMSGERAVHVVFAPHGAGV